MRVSRPSMRGSPARIWLRTIFASSVEQDVLHFVGVARRGIGANARGLDLRIDLLEALLPRLLLAQLVGFAQRRLRPARVMFATIASSFAAGCPVPTRLAGFLGQLVDRSIAACICWWPNTTAPSITSSDSSLASDSTISTAASVPATTRFSCDVVELGLGRVEHVLAVDVADARGADRTVERDAGKRQGRRGADHRGNVGVDFRIDRHHRRDDLHFVVEAVGEQRADRPVDQARGQRFLLRGPPFALEEAAGDLARGVGLFLVVDGQREEILAGLGRSWRPRAVTSTTVSSRLTSTAPPAWRAISPVSSVSVLAP